MKWKNIVPLAAILVVLLAVIILQQTTEEQVSIEEAVGFERLVPEGVSQADIHRLELFAGGKPEEKLVLARVEGKPDQWKVASHVDAPVSDEKMDEFMGILMGLQGEPRERDVSDEGLADYVLESDKAFQAVGYGADDSKLFHLLEGKRDDYNEGFARRNEENDVYVIDESFKREAGIFGEETDKAPGYAPWLDKVIYEVAQDSIERIEMRAPGKRIVVARKEEAAEDPAEAGGEDAGDSGEDGGALEEPAAQTEVTWEIVEGGPGLPAKEASIKSMLKSLAKLQCVDYAGPAKKAELGLEGETPFRTVITSDALEADIVIAGNRPDPSENGYIVVSTKPERVFEMAKNIFEKLFGVESSADFFEDEGIALEYNDIERIVVEQPEGRIELVRAGEDWEAVDPAAPLPVQQLTASGIGRLLARWQPAEYFAPDTAATGLTNPERRVTLATAEGSKTILVGNESEYFDGRYAKVEGEDQVVLMKRVDVDKIFAGRDAVFDRKLFGATAEDVSMFMLRKGEDAVVLTREGPGWRATSLGEDQQVDEDAVDAVLTALLDLEAQSIRFGQEMLPGTPEASAVFTDAQGDRHEIVFGPEEEGTRLAALPAKKLVFTVDSLGAAEILAEPGSLASETTPEPSEKAAGEPVEQPAAEGEPGGQPADPIAEEPAEGPASEPVAESASGSAAETASEAAEEPAATPEPAPVDDSSGHDEAAEAPAEG